MANGNGNNGTQNKPVGLLRTRKAEVISGISVVTLIALYGFARSVVSDFNGALEAQARAFDKRIERVECAHDKDTERQDKRLDKIESELKQRIIWIERELSNTHERIVK